jgi:hypothetical protein
MNPRGPGDAIGAFCCRSIPKYRLGRTCANEIYHQGNDRHRIVGGSAKLELGKTAYFGDGEGPMHRVSVFHQERHRHS